jgi:hypothetical protein
MVPGPRQKGDSVVPTVPGVPGISGISDAPGVGGLLVSAGLGEGNAGTGYVLRTPRDRRRGLAEVIGVGNRSAYTITISDRDEAGHAALSDLRGRGINHVANALAQSVDHILGFFRLLRTELAFYIGALNAHGRLADLGQPTCFRSRSRRTNRRCRRPACTTRAWRWPPPRRWSATTSTPAAGRS